MSTELLDIVCAPGVPDFGRMRHLDDGDWRVLADRAAQHRLEPMLHDRFAADPAIPQWLRDDWRESFRIWTMKTAAAAVDLRETVALLETAGFAPLALKGAFLAWHVYPSAPLRPMRDLDILVPRRQVVEAFALLRAHGWIASPLEAAIVESSAGEGSIGSKHLPPLIARCGTAIELHHRMWEAEGDLDHGSPLVDHDAVRARAITRGGIAYPAPEDTLAHLIVHAVYSHRLDCGPLLLWDVELLVRAFPIDWERLRTRAIAERWEPGLDLVAALLHRYFGAQSVVASANDAGAAIVPGGLVDAAAQLLLQDLGTRTSAKLAATGIVKGAGAMAAHVTRWAMAPVAGGGRRASGGEGLGSWTVSRLRRTVAELSDPAVLGQARDLGRLSKWLNA